jgi:chromosome segregation ATPase
MPPNIPRILPPPLPENQPATTKVDATAVLHQRLDKITDLIEARFAEQSANHDLLQGEVRSHGQQLLEIRVQLGRHSEGVKGASQTNLEQDAALAAIRTDVAAVKAALAQNNAWTRELVDAGKGFAKQHPQLVTALVNLTLAAATFATAWFAAKGR